MYLAALGSGVLSSLKGEEMSMSLRSFDHSLIIFPQLFWQVDEGAWVNGDSTLLEAGEEDSLHVWVTAPACLQLSLIGTESLALLPVLLPATCLPESHRLLPVAQDIFPFHITVQKQAKCVQLLGYLITHQEQALCTYLFLAH